MATVLIVDDSEAICFVLANTLTEAGHSVTTRCNGAEALAYLDLHCTELVITDIYMPECDGLELLNKIRDRLVQPAIITMSSGGGPGNLLRVSKLLGAAATIEKPFRPLELVNLVQRVLEQRDRAEQAGSGVKTNEPFEL